MPTTITGLTMSSTGLTITCPTGITSGCTVVTGTCTTITSFGIKKVISGLTAPNQTWFDSNNELTNPGKVWVIDTSDFKRGNIYNFNPVTAINSNDMNYIQSGGSPILNITDLYGTYIDTTYKRMYFVGWNQFAGTSSPYNGIDLTKIGLLTYDMISNTIYHDTLPSGTLPSGTNAQYLIQNLLVTNDNIYYSYFNEDTSTQYIRYFDRNNIIPGQLGNTGTSKTTSFGGSGNSIIQVGTATNYTFWVVGGSSGGGDNTGPWNPQVYDKYFNLLGRIDVSSYLKSLNISSPNSGNRDWQNGFYDQLKNKFYLNDIGSNNLITLIPDTIHYSSVTYSAVTSIVPYLETMNNSYYTSLTFSIDPISNKLYTNFYSTPDGISTTTFFKSYETDRDSNNLLFKNLLKHTNVQTLNTVNDGQSNSLMGTFAVPYGNNGNVYSTGGTITFFNNEAVSGNTGQFNPTDLQQVDVTNGNIPMGFYTKNTVGNFCGFFDSYTDTSVNRCPLTTGYTCPSIFSVTFSGIPYNNSSTGGTPTPTIISYELNLPNEVINTTGITYVTLTGYSDTFAIMTGSIPMSHFSGFTGPNNSTSNRIYYFTNTTNYPANEITSITSLTFQYLDSNKNVLRTCANIPYVSASS